MIDLSYKKYMDDLDYIVENTPKQTKNNKDWQLYLWVYNAFIL